MMWWLLAGSVFHEDFNGDRFDQFHYERARPTSIRSSSLYDRDGSGQSLEVTLHRDDPDVHGARRAELRLDREVSPLTIGSEVWIGFSLLVPPDYAVDESFEIVFQLHSFPDRALGEEWRSPPLDLKIEGGEFAIYHLYDRRPVTPNNTPEAKFQDSLGAVTPGAWTDFVLHLNYQLDESGSISLYRDGQLAYQYDGIVGYNDADGMFAKLGIYKPDWTYNPERSSTDERTLYFDAFRITGAGAAFEDVDPAMGLSH